MFSLSTQLMFDVEHDLCFSNGWMINENWVLLLSLINDVYKLIIHIEIV